MVSGVAAKTFTVELERVQKAATMFRVPFDREGAFGLARPPVRVTIRDYTWRTTPGVYDGVGHIVVNRAAKEATGVDAGDRVRVRMELDTEAPEGHCPVRSPLRARRRPRREGRIREAFIHASTRVRRVGRGGEASRDASSPHHGHGRARALREAAARMTALQGAFAASITPLCEHGTAVDDDAFGPLADFYVREGLDGILALGTAGEGILLRVEERRHVADLFLQASDKRLQVAVHCGAQTTADTVTLAVHAAEVGADAVVVIGPPYFKLDERSQYGHFLAAATACAPVPFYVYEFAATTGYAIAPAVLERLRLDAPNLVGLKVSDTPFDAFEKYLLPGFDVFVGPEALIADGMARGARGAVSALASALPREVAAVVRNPTPEGAARLGELRTFVERFPRQAALKRLLALQGVPITEDVRAPLRTLTIEERDELDSWAGDVLAYAESNSS